MQPLNTHGTITSITMLIFIYNDSKLRNIFLTFLKVDIFHQKAWSCPALVKTKNINKYSQNKIHTFPRNFYNTDANGHMQC
jgi:hypothetical protein